MSGGRVAVSQKERWFCDTVCDQIVLAPSPRRSSAPIFLLSFPFFWLMAGELFNNWEGRGYDDSVPGEVTKTPSSGDRTT